jgi:hypothetical protein
MVGLPRSEADKVAVLYKQTGKRSPIGMILTKVIDKVPRLRAIWTSPGQKRVS